MNVEQLAAFHACITFHQNVFITDTSTTFNKMLYEYYKQHNQLNQVLILSHNTKNTQEQTIQSWLDLGNIPEDLYDFLHLIDRQQQYFKKFKHTNHKYKKPLSKYMSTPPYPKIYSKSDSVFNRIKPISTLILTNVVNMEAYLFDHLNVLFKIVKNNPNKPFGGIQVIVEADFYQPPLYKQESYLFESIEWKTLAWTAVPCNPALNNSDKIFTEIINRARIGQITLVDIQYLHVNCLRPITNEIDQIKILFLFPKKELVHIHNEKMLQFMKARAGTAVPCNPANNYLINIKRIWVRDAGTAVPCNPANNNNINNNKEEGWKGRSPSTFHGIKNSNLLLKHNLPIHWFDQVELPGLEDKKFNELEIRYLNCWFDDQIKTPLFLTKQSRVKLTTNVYNKTKGILNGSLGTVVGLNEVENKLIVAFDSGQEIAIGIEEIPYLSHPNYKSIRLKTFPVVLAFALSYSDVIGMGKGQSPLQP